MLDQFNNINKEFFNKRILVAVSGGVDSMVLLTLLINSAADIEVAHVDHSTRDGASANDANFVQAYCKNEKVIFHNAVFEFTGGNFQAEARNFRNAFFHKLVKERNLDLIATAHHMDDVIEGFLLASFRGTHLNRLVTPREREQLYWRPLYSFDKKKILHYATNNGIPFVQDTSNFENNYTRNLYRNEILPTIYEHTPQGKKGVKKTIQKLSNDINLLNRLIELHLPFFVIKSPDQTIIDIQYLIKNQLLEILPFALVEYTFTEDQLSNIKNADTGAIFYTSDHKALKDRGNFIIRCRENGLDGTKIIDKSGTYKFGKYIIIMEQIENTSSDRNLINEDHFLLETEDFPLEIRTLQPGDKIKSERLKGKSTKITKALTDRKIDLFSKNSTLVIKSTKQILWAYPYIKSISTAHSKSKRWYKIRIIGNH